MNEWNKINPDDVIFTYDAYTFAAIITYKGVNIKVSREYVEDLNADTNLVPLEDVILEQYNKNKGVIRDRKIDQIIE
jgi:hypothetical protein